MSRVRSVVSDDGLHVILCLAFDHRAPWEEVSALKRRMIDCASVLHSEEVTGPYDFMLEASLRDMAQYHEKMAGLQAPFARLVARFEACFICKRYIRTDEPDESIWVPCPEGVQRIDCSLIDKVTAEGDYMRLHSADQSWLVHTTLRTLLERLDPAMFVQVHRSVVVRCDFIERLIHCGKRWSARLQDGTHQQIARSHVGMVFEALRIGPAKADAGSTNGNEVNENITSLAE